MAFGLWADEQMTQKVGDATANAQANHLGVMLENAEYVDKVFYFGSPLTNETLQAKSNAGVDNVTISPIDALPEWQPETAYKTSDVVQSGSKIYQCTQAGNSGANTPNWVNVAGSNTADGDVVWRCKGERYTASDIKLALSQAGLENARSGDALALGHTVKGGAAIAIYCRILGRVSDKYDLRNAPFVSLDLNTCIVNDA